MTTPGSGVSYHADLNFRPRSDEAIVIDEGDYFVFGQSKKFFEFT